MTNDSFKEKLYGFSCSHREYWVIRVLGRDTNGVMEALRKVRCQYIEHWDDIFKTITTDNGSEFSLLSGLEDLSKTLVYFAHPYTSCEKGSCGAPQWPDP